MLKTVYVAERMALGDRWLSCRRGLIFVGSSDGTVWHAIIYDPTPGAFDGYQNDAPLPFTAATPEGLWLEGIVQLGIGDDETRMHALRGLGGLKVSGEAVGALPSAASWAEARRLRRVG
jgi:hypothetical protein